MCVLMNYLLYNVCINELPALQCQIGHGAGKTQNSLFNTFIGQHCEDQRLHFVFLPRRRDDATELNRKQTYSSTQTKTKLLTKIPEGLCFSSSSGSLWYPTSGGLKPYRGNTESHLFSIRSTEQPLCPSLYIGNRALVKTGILYRE